ncbi:ribonuclease H2 subunit B-like isoform X2 [Ctenocephalides felis]|nr:ribonuclease H2 subunit B-like isoform X2 [Ctenocephalides felis]
MSFSESKRSWFINDTVASNGNLYLSTPIDPLFLILPYLYESCLNQASPLDQILKDPDFPATDRLLKCSSPEQLSLVADRKGSQDLNAYKFNKEKCLSWLATKVNLIAKVLKNKKLHVGSGAVSASFVKSEADVSDCDDDYKAYAFGIISEYINYDLSKMLKVHLGIPETEQPDNQKRKSLATNDKNTKKIKLEKDTEDFVMPIKVEKPKAPSAKEKAWGKAASGTKSISSFFMKK